MSRNMIAANAAIFARLERYCAVRRDPVASPGMQRFIATNNVEKNYLKNLRVGPKLRFGYHRSLIHLYFGSEHFIGLVGFEFEPIWPGGVVISNNAGFTTCVLAETEVTPAASTFDVRNIVEAGHKGDEGYRGHDWEVVKALFPALHVVQATEPLDNDAVWRSFLTICAIECMQGGSWIEESVADSLIALTALDIPSMPYSAISRSIFDADPRSLFMALYRCIEATYSHQSSKRLIATLGLNIPWQEMAQALEGELGWHPQEASSLNLVLQEAGSGDLEEVCRCLNSDIGPDVCVSAGRAIYSLRNSIVHFRPGTREIDIDEIDWNKLCQVMVSLVFSVFTGAYS